MNDFAAKWTYRSFHNLPKVDDFAELRFAEADLELEETEHTNLLRGRLSFGTAYLEIVGTSSELGREKTLRMRAEGVVGTPTEGWVYDYEGVLSHKWEHGDAQRPTIVGTVIRTAPHAPDRPAGYTASFIAVHRSRPAPPNTLPDAVRAHFASRVHRLHHAAWHGIRNGWNAMPEALKKQVAAMDWETPRPARDFSSTGVLKGPIVANGSGEDFLFFHRQMIVMYRDMMASGGHSVIEWVTIPEPGTAPFNDVPQIWPLRSIEMMQRRLVALKSDAYYWSCMRIWDQKFKDSSYLATLTLGELGSLLEFTVHNDLHMRWSAAPRDPETRALLELGRPANDFSKKWESPSYDWLGEFYSSHVNPFFWRLHGWVDDRINDWLLAHEHKHPGEIAAVSKGGVDWFEAGKWVEVDKPWVWPESLGGINGGHGGHHDGHNPDDLNKKRLLSLERLVEILYPSTEVERLELEHLGIAKAISPIVGAL